MKAGKWGRLGTRKVRLGASAILLIALPGYGLYTVQRLLDENRPGYCAAQKRYIPDEEFIGTAVALYEWDLNRERQRHPDGKISKKRDDPNELYDTWQNSRHRGDCCEVGRAKTESFLNRLFGWQEVEVTLHIDPENRWGSHKLFAFDICGKLLPHEFGFKLETGHGQITTTNHRALTSTN